MKKILIVISFVMLMSTGCVYKSAVRPTNQMPSRWVCEETPMEILIPNGYKKHKQTATTIDTLGEICTLWVDDKPMSFDVFFNGGAGVQFSLDDGRVLEGECTYKKDSFSIEVKNDTIFEGKYEKLNFYKDHEYEHGNSDVLKTGLSVSSENNYDVYNFSADENKNFIVIYFYDNDCEHIKTVTCYDCSYSIEFISNNEIKLDVEDQGNVKTTYIDVS